MPKVSVIIPTYNRSSLLQAAIRSVLYQTFQDFELVIVDDGSTENTPDVVKCFQDERITYIRHATNKGGSAARNTGIMNSSGRYIAFLDDDDEWLPEKLEKQVALLDRCPPLVGGVYTGILRVHKASGKIIGQRVPSKRGAIFEDMLIQNWVRTTTTVVVRKECFERVGLFDESLQSSQEYDMWLRIAKDYHFEYIPEPLAKYHIHDDKISRNHRAIVKGTETMLKKYGYLFARNKRNLSERYRNLGVHYCYLDDIRGGRGAFLKAIRICPYDLKNYFNFVLTVFGPTNFAKLKQLRLKLARNDREQLSSRCTSTEQLT